MVHSIFLIFFLIQLLRSLTSPVFVYFSVGHEYLTVLIINFTSMMGYVRCLIYVRNSSMFIVRSVFIFLSIILNISWCFLECIGYVRSRLTCFDLHSVIVCSFIWCFDVIGLIVPWQYFCLYIGYFVLSPRFLTRFITIG